MAEILKFQKFSPQKKLFKNFLKDWFFGHLILAHWRISNWRFVEGTKILNSIFAQRYPRGVTPWDFFEGVTTLCSNINEQVPIMEQLFHDHGVIFILSITDYKWIYFLMIFIKLLSNWVRNWKGDHLQGSLLECY